MIKHNYVAIIVMVIVQMAIGFVWYTILFGEPWVQGVFGKSIAEMQAEMQKTGSMSMAPYVVNIIGNFCLCFFISWLVQRLGITTFGGGLMLGVYATIGLVLPAVVIHYMFMMKSHTVIAIDAGM